MSAPHAANFGHLHRRLRLAGGLLLVALALFALSLLWEHPTAFLLFMFGGGFFLTAGVLLYLYCLAVHHETPPQE